LPVVSQPLNAGGINIEAGACEPIVVHLEFRINRGIGVPFNYYGEELRMGPITHAGNDRVKTTVVACSWVVIAKDPEMIWKYEPIKHRGGGKRAIVAGARTLSAPSSHLGAHSHTGSKSSAPLL
jgi:hypothetical protein